MPNRNGTKWVGVNNHWGRNDRIARRGLGLCYWPFCQAALPGLRWGALLGPAALTFAGLSPSSFCLAPTHQGGKKKLAPWVHRSTSGHSFFRSRPMLADFSRLAGLAEFHVILLAFSNVPWQGQGPANCEFDGQPFIFPGIVGLWRRRSAHP